MSTAHEALTAPSPLTLRVLRNLDELHELSKPWDDLLAAYPSATTFSSLEWLASWWLSFGEGRRLLVLAWFDVEKGLAGVAPFSISQERLGKFLSLRVLRLMADGSGDSDNLDFPARPGFEKRLAHDVLEYLQTHRQEWDVCQFNTLPAGSPVAGYLSELLKPNWVFFKYSSSCAAIPLPAVWNEYVEQLPREDSKNLERYRRRLEKRYTTKIRRCASESELDACLEALFRLHQLRWQNAGEPGSFASIARRDFYRVLSRRLLERGLLELWVLELDGEIAAVQFAFRFGNRVFQLQEGNDPERSSDRVGFLLRGEVLKQLIAKGIRAYDFLGGTDSHKTRWAAKAGHYTDLHFARRFSRGGAWLCMVHFLGRTKRWLRSWLPAGLWKLLHTAKKWRQGSSDQSAQPAFQGADSTTDSSVGTSRK